MTAQEKILPRPKVAAVVGRCDNEEQSIFAYTTIHSWLEEQDFQLSLYQVEVPQARDPAGAQHFVVAFGTDVVHVAIIGYWIGVLCADFDIYRSALEDLERLEREHIYHPELQLLRDSPWSGGEELSPS
jgi:hypothetical protein